MSSEVRNNDERISFILQQRDINQRNAIEICQALMYDVERVLSNNDCCNSILWLKLFRMTYTLTLYNYGDLLYENLINTFEKSISKSLSHIHGNDKFFESMTETCNDIVESIKLPRDIMIHMVWIYTLFCFLVIQSFHC